MKPYVSNIEADTLRNKLYRKVVYTGDMQIVLMTLQPGETIPREIHWNVTQFFRVERGQGTIEIGGHKHLLHNGVAVVVPKNTYHTVKNTGRGDLKLYTIYFPREHKPGEKNIRQPVIH